MIFCKGGVFSHMFKITNDKTIHLTRGDVANINVGASLESGNKHVFSAKDIIRFRVMQKLHCETIILQKDTVVESSTPTVTISLTKEDTKIGEVINKPIDYWYEIELNPDTNPQTIIGYDDVGPKVFRLYPEGSDLT